jgi:hypothetical protein
MAKGRRRLRFVHIDEAEGLQTELTESWRIKSIFALGCIEIGFIYLLRV